MKKATVLFLLNILFLFTSAQKTFTKGGITYPFTEPSDVSDDFFGTRVADPYRWMENDTAAKVKSWVAAENKTTFDYLAKIPFREKVKKRLTQIYNYARYGIPTRVGEYYFFTKNDGLQNQAVIYVQQGLKGTPEVFIDPNTLIADGTAAVSLLGASKDQKYMAYSVAKAGSDWQEIYVMEVATKKKLSDKLEWIKFSGAAWKGDGFYYSRYDSPKNGKDFSAKNEFHKVYYHKLGQPQSSDELIFKDDTNPNLYIRAQTTEDEHFLIISINSGTSGKELRVKDLTTSNSEFQVIFPGFKSNADVLNNVGDKIMVQTDLEASNQRIVLIDPKNPEKKNWQTILPEGNNLIKSASLAGGQLLVTFLKDASSQCAQYTLEGKMIREIKLPGLGTVAGLGGNDDDQEVFYSYTSFNYPPVIFRYNLEKGESSIWQQPTLHFASDNYSVKQVFFKSKDGVQVPMFIIHANGLPMNRKNPALLYGYGGFNISQTPSFSTSRMLWLENGGVLAVVNLRGGGEYGENWHQAGMLSRKQNVFDDFIAAANYLIENEYTDPDHLAIQGGSNGGLLVGACMTQVPGLFKVAIPQVGVMDMLRYSKFTVGWGWAVEYGLPDNPDMFNLLYGYSPLHNIKEGVEYPATMITTADHDDRVVPAHSFKFAATLQEKMKGTNPALIRIDVRAGHGAGKPTSKVIEEQADIFSFIFYNMGITPKALDW
jgi:prolyl oligopeptidase